MKVAHLILAHKNPEQLSRLIKALDHPQFNFYIHIDGKSNLESFSFLRAKNIFFIKNRAKIFWAGFGTIQATINGLKEIPLTKYDYINVISAQDFPIKPVNYILNYIEERKGTEFITCEHIETKWKEALPRIKKYHLINWHIPGKYYIENILNRILPERKFPYKFEIVGRANWFTITNQAATYILDFLKSHKSIVRFFKYSWGADELIFSTILYNSAFKKCISDNLVYVDWSGSKTGHPKILTQQDIHSLITSEKLFARKFDIEKDAEIFTSLEKLIK